MIIKILSNNKIKDSISKIEIQIENIIKNNSTNPLIIQLNDINKDLFRILEEINPSASPGEGVNVFTYPYLSAGAPAVGEAKGLIKIIKIFLNY